MVALEFLAIDPVVTVKLAEVEFAVTVTDAGVARAELLSDRLTMTPPEGLGLFSVTVQILEEFGPRLLGLQDREETSTGATRLTLVWAELPL
jgi:hypothetical protein